MGVSSSSELTAGSASRRLTIGNVGFGRLYMHGHPRQIVGLPVEATTKSGQKPSWTLPIAWACSDIRAPRLRIRSADLDPGYGSPMWLWGNGQYGSPPSVLRLSHAYRHFRPFRKKKDMFLFTNPSARAGYDTRSIFKRSLTGFNSEFSFS